MPKTLPKKLFWAAIFVCLGAGCTVDFGDDSTSNPTCGNGVVDAEEECDGDNFAGRSCVGEGFTGGNLVCTLDCRIELEACAGGCGNGRVEDDEVCDGANLAGASCGSLGIGFGDLACLPNCADYDRSGCTMLEGCGNNQIEDDEECDGIDLGGETCITLGYLSGVLDCGSDCTYDTSLCGSEDCGDQVREGTEACDGADLNGKTCESEGFSGGSLRCLNDCSGFDVAECMRENGDPCTDNSQCPDGFCLSEQMHGWPSGFCAKVCFTDTCESGEHCVEVGSYLRVCVPACNDFGDCREGYSCFEPEDPSDSVCLPNCESDAVCENAACNLWQGLCGVSAGGGDNGTFCNDDSDCKSGVCGGPWGQNTVCVSYCDLSSEVCPGDDVCSNVYYSSRGDLGLCLDACGGGLTCVEQNVNCNVNYWGPGQICYPL